MKKFLFILVIILVLPMTRIFYNVLSSGEFYTFDSDLSKKYLDNQKREDRKIFLVHIVKGFGGAEMHTLNLYRGFIEKGYNVNLLVSRVSGLAEKCREFKMPFYTTNAENYKRIKALFRRVVRSRIEELAKNKDVIQVYTEDEGWASKGLPARLVITKHVPTPFKYAQETMSNMDGIIAVSKYIKEDLEQINNKYNLGVKSIDFIAPFFDEERFLNFKTSENRQKFFKEHFNVTINELPVICVIANMYKDALHKNHRLLFKVLQTLVHDKNKFVQVVLAGDGSDRENLEKIIADYKLTDNVHFLGFTDKIADVLYHSDINILPSGREAFGIVLLEGALMKKPLIYSTGNGGEAVVIHEKTGLLFKNNDEVDLLRQIERLLDNPKLAKQLGENAYTHVKQNLSVQAGLEKMEEFYNKIW